MNKSLKKKYYLLVLLIIIKILINQNIYSRQSENDNSKLFFDKTEWQNNVQKKDYTETFREKKDKEIKDKEDRRNFQFGPLLSAGFMKVILILILVGVLSYLLYIILKRSFNIFAETVPNKKLDGAIENLEENIHDADFNKLLQHAIETNQYKLAVRIFYLQIIKILSDKELIKWKKNKTNGHYVNEMFNHESGKKFVFLTSVYEQAWFSEHEIHEKNYRLISKEFSEFLSELA